MSAVVSAVSNVVSSVADVVVGAVSDVADFVVDEIVKPVADVVVDTVKKAVDDPIGTIGMIASVVYPPLAPLIMGATTLAKGGDIGDALKSAALGYVGGQAAAGLGGATNSALAGSGLSASTASTLSQIAGNVGRAAVTGGDPLAALVSGGIGAGVGELAGQIPGFSELPISAQQSVKAAMAAELQGQDASQAVVNNALNAGIMAASNYLGPGTMAYEYDPANNPADPNADSNPDLNGSVYDGLQAPSMPSTNYDFVGNYGLSGGLDATSSLAAPKAAPSINPDGTLNYELAESTGNGGLQMPYAPTLSSMNGGYGLTTPVEGGYMTEMGFVPTDSSSILGDANSFINDPNVLGKTVIGQDTLLNPSADTGASYGRAATTGGLSGGGTGGGGAALPGMPGYDDQASLWGGYKTAGEAGYQTAAPGLKQIYDSLTSGATGQYPSSAYGAPVAQAPDPLQGVFNTQRAGQYYAQGGAVQHFAEGDQPTDSSTTTVSTAGPNAAGHAQLLASLKSLGGLNSGIKTPQHNVQKAGSMGSQYAPRVLPQLMASLLSRGMNFAEGGQPRDRNHPNYDGTPVFRTGGLEGLGGKYVEGKGDGTSDDISAMLANGEYVFSADVVSALGNGSNKAGADKLGEMVEAIRARARSAPPDKLPPDAKSPLEYLKSPKGKKHV